MNTILTDDERPKLPETPYQLYYEWPDDEEGYGGSEVVDGDAYTAKQMEAYADARESAVHAKLAQQADRQRVPDEPDWRHPKIQALIGADARNRICIDLVWRILENPRREFTAGDMEYWDKLHDKVQEVALAAAPEAPAQASAVDEREAFTVVYRNPTPEEVGQFMDHPKSVWFGWCHAAYQRDEARAALAQKGGAA